MVMSGRSVNLITLFLDRLKPPKRLTSASCTSFRQQLTTVRLETAEGETKVFSQVSNWDLWLSSQTRYRLRHATQPHDEGDSSGIYTAMARTWKGQLSLFI